MFISPAYAEGATSAGAGIFELLFPLVVVFAIIYFMILRPQQKRQRTHAAMIAAVKRNDVVVTQGGLVGKVTKVKDEELEISVAGTPLVVMRSMVLSVRTKGEQAS